MQFIYVVDTEGSYKVDSWNGSLKGLRSQYPPPSTVYAILCPHLDYIERLHSISQRTPSPKLSEYVSTLVGIRKSYLATLEESIS